MRARTLNTAYGRWMTEDPDGSDAGDPNLYAYCGGRPAILTDPSGTSALVDVGDRTFGLGGPPWHSYIRIDSDCNFPGRRGNTVGLYPGGWPHPGFQDFLGGVGSIQSPDPILNDPGFPPSVHRPRRPRYDTRFENALCQCLRAFANQHRVWGLLPVHMWPDINQPSLIPQRPPWAYTCIDWANEIWDCAMRASRPRRHVPPVHRRRRVRTSG